MLFLTNLRLGIKFSKLALGDSQATTKIQPKSWQDDRSDHTNRPDHQPAQLVDVTFKKTM